MMQEWDDGLTNRKIRKRIVSESMEIQNSSPLDEGHAQLTAADTGRTDEERKAMRERGFDDLDMRRARLA